MKTELLAVLDKAAEYLTRHPYVHADGMIAATLGCGFEEAAEFRRRHLSPRHRRGAALHERGLAMVRDGWPQKLEFHFVRAVDLPRVEAVHARLATMLLAAGGLKDEALDVYLDRCLEVAGSAVRGSS